MKRATVAIVLFALLAVPLAVAAQYYDPDDAPGGRGNGNMGGGIQVGGAGDITIGGGMMGGAVDVGSDESVGSEGVTIVDFAFQPSSIFVGVGDTVEWANAGAAPHTVDANDGSFGSGTINPGGGYSQSFDTAGVYAYHCDFHPQMRGTIVVN